ncbi:MAG: cytochrome c oxidase assembly protein [Acidimicrobiia bacterium]
MTLSFGLLLWVGLGAAALAYDYGDTRMRNRVPVARAHRRRETAAFWAGLVTVAAALAPPLDDAADRSFPVHMVQHLVLVLVAAPLLALGAPEARMSVCLRRAGVAVRPLPGVGLGGGWLAFLVPLWLWHAPAFYDAALRSDAVHALEHATMLAGSFVFCRSVILAVRRRHTYGLAILAVATSGLHSGALGALLLTSSTPLSVRYGAVSADPLHDQQLAGVLMWVGAAPVYVLSTLALLAGWIRYADGLTIDEAVNLA